MVSRISSSLSAVVLCEDVLLYQERSYRNNFIIDAHKLLKKVQKLKFAQSYFSFYQTFIDVFDIIREPVYSSLKWYKNFKNGYEIVRSIAEFQGQLGLLTKDHHWSHSAYIQSSNYKSLVIISTQQFYQN